MGFLDWLQNHLLTCPYKAMTGNDCPGCGMQRSFLELLRGNLHSSFELYPALIPLLCTFLFLFLHLKFKFEAGAKVIMYLFIFSTAVVIISYVIKQVHLYSHG
jgi:hypothetical protein